MNPRTFFTGEQFVRVSEFLRSSEGQRYLAFLALSRPPILGGKLQSEPAVINAARADGWEACIRLTDTLTDPLADEQEDIAYPTHLP